MLVKLPNLFHKIHTEEPRAPSELRAGVDPLVDEVILKCLAKDPGERTDLARSRPDQARQLHEALKAWRGSSAR